MLIPTFAHKNLRFTSHCTELLSVACIYIYLTYNVHPITNAMWNVSGFYDSHLSNIVIKLDFTPMNYIMYDEKKEVVKRFEF